MKRIIFRIGAMLLMFAVLVSLCACGGETQPTTTAGDVTTTTVADEVTTVADGTTATATEAEQTTADGAVPTAKDTTTATTTKGDGNAIGETSGNKATDPWGKVTKPTTKRQTTTSATATTAANNKTLATVKRDPKYQNDYGIYHTLKGYCFGTVIKASEWLPVVGYMKDGKMVDAMYTSTTIMPSPTNVYYRDFGTKEQWDAWREHSYKNLDTLNEAAKSVQDTLQLKEHKVKVFLTLVNPSDAKNPGYYSNWGSLNGTTMKVTNKSHRLEMVKYMVDSYIAEMKAKNYQNLEFVGFYWFDEYIVQEDLDWYKQVTDYIRSKGLITMISPYYKASGWNLYEKAGFDLHSMQSNYFPERKIGEMNAGSEKRLDANAALINNGESGGIEMECNPVKKDCYTALKLTMKVGIETGIVNGYHVHYFGGGPKMVMALSKSRDAYERSCYDELYKYMHNTLTVAEMQIDPLEDEQGILDGFKEDL